jgi:hypothetical protein
MPHRHVLVAVMQSQQAVRCTLPRQQPAQVWGPGVHAWHACYVATLCVRGIATLW